MPKRAATTLQRNDWRRTLAAALWTATTIMAAVVVSRRLGGHFAGGLHPAPTSLIVALLTGLNMAAAALLKSATTDRAMQRWSVSLGVFLATLVPPFSMGVSLLAAGSTTGFPALVTLALLCAVAMLVCGTDIRWSPSADESPSDIAVTVGLTETINGTSAVRELVIAEAPEPDESSPLGESDETDAEDLAEGDGQAFSQSMSRVTQDDGSETIEGTVTLRFGAGQQIGVVHLPFSPPLVGQPQVSCYLLEDLPVRLRATATHTYGARLEARRIETTSDPEEIIVGYTVSASESQTRAA
ncbi:MAG: hypothetical protein HON53_21490 [Planctomycetaceae bacterium]|jgi:hypothetical protein|nr:hypothetical protein [Planctomycetaceae bacterium]MBT6157070.1 hypothetical protein [Planctomycetaceae bacterium]MBT6484364.1 hypothetical protein [Planctomycetaceae bacterium]MBT6498097.1 hypothetical protein [Planctomycetaceae bacterium]